MFRMQYEQKYNRSIEDDFPETSSSLHQNIINNIRITSREFDIIACLLGGRSTKKISSFLLISTNTVEVHIRNIMQKMGCASRENIIDFLEKSEHFAVMKQHYAKMLIKLVFELELKKISNLVKVASDTACVNIYCSKQKDQSLIILNLEKHLGIIGVKPNINILNLRKTNIDIMNAGANLGNDLFVFLDQSDQQFSCDVQKNFPNYIDAAKHTSYYFLFFEVLKTLFPNTNFEKNIREFKKQYEIIFDPSYLPKQQIERKPLKEKEKEVSNSLNAKKKYNLTTISIIVGCSLLCIFVGFFVLHVKQEIHAVKNKLQRTAAIIPEDPLKNQVFINLPVRNNKFTGRENDLKYLQVQLNNQKIGIITQAVAGLGGIGKTQLATEFAYRSLDNQYYKAVFWIAAETPNAMNNVYKKIADYLQLENEALNFNELKKLVHNDLCVRCKGAKILFILDNVANFQEVKQFLNSLHEQLNTVAAHVLITSRSQLWPEAPLILDIFTPKEASTFIRKHLSNENEASVENLGKKLNYFPLALSQAIAYIKDHSNIAHYIEDYEIKTQEYLDKISSYNDQYTQSLWATWNIILPKLSLNGQKILFTAAYLDPDEIPIDFFSSLTIKEIMEAIEDLRKHSLITLTANNNSFKMHRSLQEVVRLTGKSNTKWKTNYGGLNSALHLLESKFDFNFVEFKKWNLWRKYLVHAQTIAEHAIKADNHSSDLGIKLYAKLAMFMTYILADDSDEIIQIWLRLLQLTNKYNKQESTSFLAAIINSHLGAVRQRALNQHDESKINFDRAIQIYSNIPSNFSITKKEKNLVNILRHIPLSNNVKLSDELNYNLGYTFGRLATLLNYVFMDPKLAIINYNKSMQIFSKLEEVSSITKLVKYGKVSTLNNFGMAYIHTNNLMLAETSLKTSKELTDQMYDENHRQRALADAAIAHFYNYIGKFKESDDLFKKAINVLLNSVSSKHYLINIIKIRQSCNSYMHGDYSGAKILLEEAVDNLDGLNNEYWYWLTKLHFARIYEFMGQYDKSLQFTNDSLTLAKQHLKDQMQAYMAFQLPRSENWIKSKKLTNVYYCEKMLELTKQLFGESNYQTARYYQLYGQSLANTKHFKKALTQYEKAKKFLDEEKISHSELVNFHQQNLQTLQSLMEEANALS